MITRRQILQSAVAPLIVPSVVLGQRAGAAWREIRDVYHLATSPPRRQSAVAFRAWKSGQREGIMGAERSASEEREQAQGAKEA